MEKLFTSYLGLVGLGLVLFYVFSRPHETSTIITSGALTGGDFIATLQGRV